MSSEPKVVETLKVAQVFSDSEIAINGGRNKGVKVKSIVRVVEIMEVIDPDTKERLGSARVPKVNFSVTSVTEKFSIARITSTYVRGTARQLKRITQDPDLAGAATALVQIGDAVTVEIPPEPPAPPAAADDIPF